MFGTKKVITESTLAWKTVNSKVMASKSPPILNCGLDPAGCLPVSGLCSPQDDVENEDAACKQLSWPAQIVK